MQTTELSVVELLEINPPEPQPETPRKPFLCRHIFADGRQCGSRALREQQFCYYHYAHRVPVLANRRRRQKASGFDLSCIDGLDNHTSIQISLAEVLGRVANNTIEPKRAWLLLYGLQIAGNNLRRARPTPEAAVADAIVEDEVYGQLAELEPGRPKPPSLVERMKALLREDPNADLSRLAEDS